jgi:AMMECR1 domain-containing protein
MTLAAALNDPHSAPMEASELEYLTIEISVLGPLYKISTMEELELGKHGIYLIKGDKWATLLPHETISTGWTREEFLGHLARDKAGLGHEEWKEADIFVFEAIVFSEERDL